MYICICVHACICTNEGRMKTHRVWLASEGLLKLAQNFSTCIYFKSYYSYFVIKTMTTRTTTRRIITIIPIRIVYNNHKNNNDNNNNNNTNESNNRTK